MGDEEITVRCRIPAGQEHELAVPRGQTVQDVASLVQRRFGVEVRIFAAFVRTATFEPDECYRASQGRTLVFPCYRASR